MKKLLIIILLFTSLNGLFSQCASEYIGIYRVKPCSYPDTITNYLWSSIISEITPNQILISNFADIPNEVIFGNEDTIIADLNCDNDSIYLQTVVYFVNEGSLTYSGSGQLYSDSIKINLHQINPDGSNESCLIYKKGNIDKILQQTIIESKVNIWPNPASSIIKIDFNNLELSRIEIINSTGHIIRTYYEFQSKIDISLIHEGFYYIKFSTKENGVIIKKLIKY